MSTARKNTARINKAKRITISRWRFFAVVACLLALPLLLVWHIARLQVMPDEDRGAEFLQNQGDARTVRVREIPANRGLITDRHGETLAVSTPVATLWANPQVLSNDPAVIARLAGQLGVKADDLQQRLARYANKEFMFLARQLAPADAKKIMDLKIDGVHQRREFKRYYPAHEVTAQLVGVTNVDDRGQEGVELTFDEHLTGKPGAKRVLKDLKGNVIKDLELIRREQPGKDVALSIDLRLQYLAYRELKEAVKRFGAKAGSVVMLDVASGEVLAMANQPSFNPNAKGSRSAAAMRNRAVTDRVEPGSTMKPFTMVAALESGKFSPNSVVDTGMGYVRVGYKDIKDPLGYGVLDMAGVLAKSSQVGTSKVALALDPHHVREVFARGGLGQATGLEFPGEIEGYLPAPRRWDDVTRTTLAFGYGLNASPLQIAKAYAVLAARGESRAVTLLKNSQPSRAQQVIEPQIARQVMDMMKAVTEPGGTGTKAALAAYQVAGKTGTARKVAKGGGYDNDRHIALFAGAVPADDPKLVCVVVIDEPTIGDSHGGGTVAAPVFSGVMAESLRLLRVPPDTDNSEQVTALKESPPVGGAT
ncbi:penicillin-binding transpeptidase domain-containing protein [Porticoccus sp. W117]|uniref:peptidoglycan D,D-transpeptidase FtsI family protein n=1 Tax=Porticoccus sp. W117 TaxID=3054777 RepID=UPI0025984746|nr:penicillin-binding transpeptidase domain-containing protein [Porticoccus sp. W117]MDM3871748.1 penicillin-binding transpeptidase domain-containing protein [Porticoccus sp. W117]